MFEPISLAGKLFRSYLRMQNHPSKIRIQNWIGESFFKKGIVVKDEHNIFFRLDANDWITRTMLLEGSYERQSVALAVEIMKEGEIFVDIGANFGLFANQISVHNPVVRVLAVEPNYQILPSLIGNLQLNKTDSRVNIVQAAVSSSDDLVTLAQPSENNLGSTMVVNNTKGLLSVPCVRLEKLFNQFGLKKIDLIKIDIEGNEFEVFRDFDFGKFDIQNIILEFNHLSRISLDELLNFFKSKGFAATSVNNLPLAADTAEIPENNIWFKKIRG